MLRFLALVSLRLFVVSSLIGVLIARQWGWSEYASPDLYVVYYQFAGQRNAYFVVKADGQSDGERLTREGDPIARVDCSPDGRSFAFMTEAAHLYVVTQNGILYDRQEAHLYTTINVADDGTTALFDPVQGALMMTNRDAPLSPPDEIPYALDRIDISSQGLVLWNRHFDEIQVVSLASGEIISSVMRGQSGVWLAPGRIFTYYDLVTDLDGIVIRGGQYLMDALTQTTVRIGGWSLVRPLSPDGTKVAAALTGGDAPLAQVVVYNLFGRQNRIQVTHDTQKAAQPICFLAFRPDMLTQ